MIERASPRRVVQAIARRAASLREPSVPLSDLVDERVAAALEREREDNGLRCRAAVAESMSLIRAEFTVMPRFGFHQPTDYLAGSPAPIFTDPVLADGEVLPLPAGPDRMGYSVDDAVYLSSGRGDAALVRAQIARHLDRTENLAILDFGCSTGRVLRHFHEDHRSRGWRLHGVDVQANCIEWLRRHFPNEFVIYTGTVLPKLPFPDGSLDVIYGFSVFTHIKYLWDMWLLELRRVLKPGGLLIQTIHAESAWEFYHAHRHEEWVRQALPSRIIDIPTMDVDWFHYGDIGVSQAFWRREVARKYWGRYLEVLDILPPPGETSFQDWMICRRP